MLFIAFLSGWLLVAVYESARLFRRKTLPFCAWTAFVCYCGLLSPDIRYHSWWIWRAGELCCFNGISVGMCTLRMCAPAWSTVGCEIWLTNLQAQRDGPLDNGNMWPLPRAFLGRGAGRSMRQCEGASMGKTMYYFCIYFIIQEQWITILCLSYLIQLTIWSYISFCWCICCVCSYCTRWSPFLFTRIVVLRLLQGSELLSI